MTTRFRPIGSLLPHARPMILIDEVVACAADSLSAAVLVRAGIPFFEPGRGVPAHVALEWMAQTSAACAGNEMIEKGEKVRLGLLLGTRDFRACVPWFLEGERFIVTASIVFRDTQMGVFDCAVARSDNGEAVATAQLTTYQPGDEAALMTSAGAGRTE